MKKILVVKLGLSETLDPEIGKVPSLGDVLRTTPILPVLKEKYPDSHISWLVDEAAYPLLDGNPFIDRILLWDAFTGFQLMAEYFDILVNLEKNAGLCALSTMINAWQKFGFRFDPVRGVYQPYEGAEYVYEVCTDPDAKRNHMKYWQEAIIEMVGGQWKKQSYVLGYRPRTEETFDVGFNYQVGKKWPEKAWPTERWRALESMLVSDGLSVSWQEGLESLYRYMDWINSCRAIVTNDSLGLHIALAMDKKVIALFGPTRSEEIYLNGGARVIQKTSMDKITVPEVYRLIRLAKGFEAKQAKAYETSHLRSADLP
jgi:heptosyltransferase-2